MTPRVIRRQRYRPLPARLPEAERFVTAVASMQAQDARTPIEAAAAGLAAAGYRQISVSFDPMRLGVRVHADSELVLR